MSSKTPQNGLEVHRKGTHPNALAGTGRRDGTSRPMGFSDQFRHNYLKSNLCHVRELFVQRANAPALPETLTH